MKRFVDAAHSLGIAVIVDVVLNHGAPLGSACSAFSPGCSDALCFFTH